MLCVECIIGGIFRNPTGHIFISKNRIILRIKFKGVILSAETLVWYWSVLHQDKGGMTYIVRPHPLIFVVHHKSHYTEQDLNQLPLSEGITQS
jgi:hypothetical protein